MTKRDDFQMELTAYVTGYRKVSLNLKITNNSPNDYFINPSGIWATPFFGSLPFSIHGPSNIPCYGLPTFHHGRQGGLEIKKETSVVNVVDLSEICMFTKAKSGYYIVNGWSNFFLFNSLSAYDQGISANPTDYVNLDATTNFTFIDNDELSRQPISGDLGMSNQNEF